MKDIHDDGFTVDAEVPISFGGNSTLDTVKELSETVSGVGETLDDLAPDLVVLLGDRYEIFAGAQAACVLGIPIAHLHGGERSEGTMDESFRHAITKLAQYHFVAAEPYRKRVIQLGEQPENVHNVGALALDAIRNETLLPRPRLENELDLTLENPVLLVTYHPPTHEKMPSEEQIRILLDSLETIGGTQIFTGTNPDPGYKPIREAIKAYCDEAPKDRRYVTHLGHQTYVSLISEADAVVGNSSSGLYEAPFLGTPTLNVGSRQAGRLKPDSVIDVPLNPVEISKGLEKSLSDDFQSAIREGQTPYGDGKTAENIIQRLQKQSNWSIQKEFYDLRFPDPAAEDP